MAGTIRALACANLSGLRTRLFVHRCAREQADGLRSRFGRPVVGDCERNDVRCRVVEGAHDVAHRMPVDGGVVKFGEDRE
jgi:hypothetical protein